MIPDLKRLIFLVLCISHSVSSLNRVSSLTESQADRRAKQVLHDFEMMKLEFKGERFQVYDLDRDFDDAVGIVIGRNWKQDKIKVSLPITVPGEQPRTGPGDITIKRKRGRDEYYSTRRSLKVTYQRHDFYKVTGTFYDDDGGSGPHFLDMRYGFSLGLHGDAELKMNPRNQREATLNGVLGAQTFVELPEFKRKHPKLKTIVMVDVPGSNADRFNTLTGVRLRRLGLNTKMLKNSRVNSGGVDLYAAGKKRYAEKGAEVGVHSWCCDDYGREGWEVPRGDPEHQPYVNYLKQMLGSVKGEAFYYYTIKVAKSDDIHKMPWGHMRSFNLVTDEI